MAISKNTVLRHFHNGFTSQTGWELLFIQSVLGKQDAGFRCDEMERMETFGFFSYCRERR